MHGSQPSCFTYPSDNLQANCTKPSWQIDIFRLFLLLFVFSLLMDTAKGAGQIIDAGLYSTRENAVTACWAVNPNPPGTYPGDCNYLNSPFYDCPGSEYSVAFNDTTVWPYDYWYFTYCDSINVCPTGYTTTEIGQCLAEDQPNPGKNQGQDEDCNKTAGNPINVAAGNKY
jgi:hypothetical protein